MSQNSSAHVKGKGVSNPMKRKAPPGSASKHENKRPKLDHRSKQRDARQLSTQTTLKAFQNGQLDVDQFVQAREFEIQALEAGMSRSKQVSHNRAFQQVPKDLRRRTASHNVQRVPKRLRARSRREMAEDNTPTVTARRRKPTRHMRLRLETVKRLRALGAKEKQEGEGQTSDDKVTNPRQKASKQKPVAEGVARRNGIATRPPQIKVATLATPPVPRAKFRKRQVHKAWLPTHLYHAKRARMTPPSQPLWRFSIALTPTVKSYRPTHRASVERGAVAWDTSYLSTIGLKGQRSSIKTVLRGLGFGMQDGTPSDGVWGAKGLKWHRGLRVREWFIREREPPHNPIAPVVVIWAADEANSRSDATSSNSVSQSKVFVRLHPSSFFQVWQEILRLAKVAKPSVKVEDLRFEVGSIQITGPGSTEALLGVLWPKSTGNDDDLAESGHDKDVTSVGHAWTSLAGLASTSLLPANALLGFDVTDPRLHHPPRTIKVPKFESGEDQLLELLSRWPVDRSQGPPAIFDQQARLAAGSKLPSQKSINRRKALARPGEYPDALPKDPNIPILAYIVSDQGAAERKHEHVRPSTWTIMLPWKCVQAVWYSLVHYPLSTGQQPRLGGLDQVRQLAFEAGQPWFPADFPGTQAGWEWEMTERERRYENWRKRPKGKRVSWEKVEAGGGKKGEHGKGWACDWELLLSLPTLCKGDVSDAKPGSPPSVEVVNGIATATRPVTVAHLPPREARMLLQSAEAKRDHVVDLSNTFATVRLTLLTRGVPQVCARIYRLPSATEDKTLRSAWLALMPSRQPRRRRKQHQQPLPRLPKDAPKHVIQQRLAASLLQAPQVGDDDYPSCPGEQHLVGFVTTGNFNLSEGQGTGIGSVVVGRVLDDVRSGSGDESRLCIVRCAGTETGRLARWDVVG